MNTRIKLLTQVRSKLLLTIFVFAVVWFGNCTKNANQEASKDGGDSQSVVVSNAAWKKVVESLNFPEGPAWNEHERSLCFSNCYGGWITRLAHGQVDTFLTAHSSPFTFEKTNGMTFHNGHLFACDFGVGAILKISPGGKTEIYASTFEGKAFNRPNDLTFDGNGSLYFTDPKSYSREVLDGRVFCVRAQDKTIIQLADSLGFPNGIAFSNDGKQLYVCESAFERILRFDVQAEGRLRNKQVFVELPGGDPDGIDFDREGNLYAAHFGGGAVYVIAPDGSIRQKIPAPGKKPTNIEFGGDDLKTLFLTEVETSALYQCRVEIAGTAALVVNK
ncbi:MAG: SMP-30/gluconolactonase/LRE family protein [bacterium]